MSRIGRKPVEIPKGVTVSITNDVISAKGPKGTLQMKRHADVNIKQDKDEGKDVIVFERKGNLGPQRAAHGLMRALVNNMLTGVTTGFTKTLEINGVGYKAELKGTKIDAVFLLLHGAMATDDEVDPEGEFLERLRPLLPTGVPVFGVFDLHANFTRRIIDLSDWLVAYRENPHTDAREATMRAADLLQRCLESGRIPKQYWRRPPIMWPPTGVGTADSPMKDLEAMARKIEAEVPGVWCANVIAGFAWPSRPATVRTS